VEASNAHIWTAAIIEEIEAVQQFDQIATVDGLDAVWPGPVDLAASLGYPGQVQAPPVLDVLNTVIRKAVENPALDIGAYITSPEDAADWVRKGANVLIYSMDGRVISNAYREALAHLRRAVASAS
jgi:4-hydroxy-2-oxoheptanedioate aldolase